VNEREVLTISKWGEWGDLIHVADIGRIYTIDAVGRLRLAFGSPKTFDTNVPADRNDDGSKNRCVATAFEYLGLSTVKLDEYRKNAPDPDSACTPQKLINDLLSAYEKLSWTGMVGDFIKQHPTGNYYVSYYNDYTETRGHAFALVQGMAHNITYKSMVCEVDHAWRIDVEKD
jgi:hypothetical protein